MKKTKHIIFAISVLLVAVAVVLVISGGFRNTDPIYSAFEYVNVDGTVATVTMIKTDSHFENISFEICRLYK